MNYHKRVSDAISFYLNKGYQWIDTPWIVPEKIRQCTFQGTREKCDLGYLVGSAEQGFIELMAKDILKDGLYVSAGPCFRFDDIGKRNSEPYFYKVELCHVGYGSRVSSILYDAKEFLGGHIVSTADGFDLEINNIEIGSYGYRSIQNPYLNSKTLHWSYGTGLAEPRYSIAVQSEVRLNRADV